MINNGDYSSIGLGCLTFSREIDQAASFAMMDHALAHGITFFETAGALAALDDLIMYS